MGLIRHNDTLGGDHVPVTVANSGGSNGDAFTAATTVGPGTLVYDIAKRAIYAAGNTTTESEYGEAYVLWEYPVQVDSYTRTEFFLPPNPAGGMPLMQNDALQVVVTGDGFGSSPADGITVVHSSTSGVIVLHSTSSVPTDNWFRVETHLRYADPGGGLEVRIFANRFDTEPSEVLQASFDQLYLGTHVFSLGLYGSAVPTMRELWFANPALDDTYWVGAADGWYNIDGATHSTLTFVAEMADDGAQFRAKYSNVNGEAITKPATLTVTPDTTITDPPDTPDPKRPDKVVEAWTAGSGNLLDIIRRFSTDVRRAVRLTSEKTVQIVHWPSRMPAGMTQADAASMYHSSTRVATAGVQALSLESNNLAQSASADLCTNDVRLVTSTWRIPDELPVYGIGPAPVARVTYTFSPQGFDGTLEFVFPEPTAIVRRS